MVKNDATILTGCKTRPNPLLGTTSESVKYRLDLSDHSKLAIENPAIDIGGKFYFIFIEIAKQCRKQNQELNNSENIL